MRMGKTLKYLLIGLVAVFGLLIAAILVFSLTFDPNDYRDRISLAAKEATGRDLVIAGDLGVSLFPWLAVEVGRTQLGNAEGFGPEPFATFESAELSVRLLPMLLRREVEVGKASLEGLRLNLAVAADGRNNWDDLADGGDAPAADEAASEGPASLGIGSVEVTDAALTYVDAQAGTTYRLTDLNVGTGAIREGEPVDVEAGFAFSAEPDAMAGTVEFDAVLAQDGDVISLADVVLALVMTGEMPLDVELRAPSISADLGSSIASPGELTFRAFDVNGKATVEPFSWAGDITPTVTLRVDAFSPRTLMHALAIEAPETADPDALGKLVLDAKAVVGTSDVRLTDVVMTLDDTRFTGSFVWPLDPAGMVRMNLAADSINLDRYMAPPQDEAAAAAAGDEPPLEIPVDLIRDLNAKGTFTLDEALMGGMTFTDVEVGIENANARLRVHPISATFFDGQYQGDIRIDASKPVATITANEQIRDVSMSAMAKTLFEQENVTGLVNGTFKLGGTGNNMADVQKSLNGTLSFTLADGAYEGVDVWYQLRRARALLRQETPPEPVLPPRTPFSEVSATGKVTDGVMQNDDFTADLPFMRLTGAGRVNLVSGEIDYGLSGRVLEKPESVGNATPEELGDLTRAVIPLKITGSLDAPKVTVDVAGMAKKRAEDELRERLLDKLGGDDEPPAEGEEEKPKDAEDVLKDRLKDLLGR